MRPLSLFQVATVLLRVSGSGHEDGISQWRGMWKVPWGLPEVLCGSLNLQKAKKDRSEGSLAAWLRSISQPMRGVCPQLRILARKIANENGPLRAGSRFSSR